MDYQVTCVTFVIPGNRTSGIAMLGVDGTYLTGPALMFTRGEVGERVFSGADRFFVDGPGLLSPRACLVAHPVGGDWFIQTEPDGRHDNNLLSLPECATVTLGNLLRPPRAPPRTGGLAAGANRRPHGRSRS